jgi:hypothetical protein
MERQMKKITLAILLATFVAAPALAQSPYDPYNPYGPYGYYSGYGSNVVIADGGRVVGADPDPNVRLDLLRTAQGSDIYNY